MERFIKEILQNKNFFNRDIAIVKVHNKLYKRFYCMDHINKHNFQTEHEVYDHVKAIVDLDGIVNDLIRRGFDHLRASLFVYSTYIRAPWRGAQMERQLHKLLNDIGVPCRHASLDEDIHGVDLICDDFAIQLKSISFLHMSSDRQKYTRDRIAQWEAKHGKRVYLIYYERYKGFTNLDEILTPAQRKRERDLWFNKVYN